MKKVAIVVPVYNVEKYVIECLESIKKQTHENFKVFIVNDGSTDSSEKVIQNFIKYDDRFILINQSNLGLGAARNLALDNIEKDNFDFVAFVDSDDKLEPTYLQELLTAVEINNSDIACCAYYLFSNGVNIFEEKPEFEKKILNKEEFVELIFSYGKWSKIAGHGGMVWKNLYRAKLIKGFRFTIQREIVEDELFNISLVPYISRVSYISRPLYGYRQRASSLVRKDDSILRLFNGREQIPPILLGVSNYAYQIAVLKFVSMSKSLLSRNLPCNLSRVLIYKETVKKCLDQNLICGSDRRACELLIYSPFLFKAILKMKYIWSCIRFWRKKKVYLDN